MQVDRGGRHAQDDEVDPTVEEPAGQIVLVDVPDSPAPGGAPQAPGPMVGTAVDPRRGILWAGAAPMVAGSGRVGLGVAGGWLGSLEEWRPVIAGAGVGLELDAAVAPTPQLALTATIAVSGGELRRDGALAPGQATGGIVAARWLVVDNPLVRVAPFVAGGVGVGGDVGLAALYTGGDGVSAPVSVLGGGVAFELPFHEVLVDVALPLGGVVLDGALPAGIPLTGGPYVPLFLLAEVGFTWQLGPYTSFRLGYLAVATSWSWRYHRDAFTLEVSGYTNVLTGSLATRAGWAF